MDRLIEAMISSLPNGISKPLAIKQQDIAEALLSELKRKNPKEAIHAMRVRRYCTMMALQASLVEPERVCLYQAAELHDIGKLTVRNCVLDHTIVQDDLDRDLLKCHPHYGGQILSKLNFKQCVVDGVIHHHERWDGRGYPDGLSRERIPFIARIIAVADCFDDLTSGRANRDKVGVCEALIEIVKDAGAQFDPQITDLFVETMIQNMTMEQRQRICMKL